MANLLGHTFEGLFSVCGNCHFRSEFRSGRKVTPKEATTRLKQRRKYLKNRKAWESRPRSLKGVDRDFKERIERDK